MDRFSFVLLIAMALSLFASPCVVTAARSGGHLHNIKAKTPSHAHELGSDPGPTECDTMEYRHTMLEFIKEMPLVGLFQDVKSEAKFEASGMTVANGWLWVVFDNLHALGRVDEHFEFRSSQNQLLGAMESDSQFEGLTYVESTGHFFAIEEVYAHEKLGLLPMAHELKITEKGTNYRTVQKCPVHFPLTHANKGFEGLHYHELGEHKYLMGLCEGNYCVGGQQSKESGNGRVVVTKFNGKKGDACAWDVVKVVHVPKKANFTDYSGMAFRGNKAAIISQESSKLWVGTFDFNTLEFTDDGKVYNFPRDNHCDLKYCNVEGIQWLDDVRFVIASDKAKSYQPFRCVAKEERLSIFALPKAVA